MNVTSAALQKLPATTECEQLWGPRVLPNSGFCASLDSLKASYLQSILELAGKRQSGVMPAPLGSGEGWKTRRQQLERNRPEALPQARAHVLQGSADLAPSHFPVARPHISHMGLDISLLPGFTHPTPACSVPPDPLSVPKGSLISYTQYCVCTLNSLGNS